MSIKAFYHYLNTTLAPGDSEVLKKITNPGAMLTVNQIMVINLSNASFTLSEIEQITKELSTKTE